MPVHADANQKKILADLGENTCVKLILTGHVRFVPPVPTRRNSTRNSAHPDSCSIFCSLLNERIRGHPRSRACCIKNRSCAYVFFAPLVLLVLQAVS
jgi:hypothetical protein